MATQLPGAVMPISQPVKREKARAVTEDETKYSVFIAMRQARANQRLFGVREKKRREAEEDK